MSTFGAERAGPFLSGQTGVEPFDESSGSNVIPRRARPGLAGSRPHTTRTVQTFTLAPRYLRWASKLNPTLNPATETQVQNGEDPKRLPRYSFEMPPALRPRSPESKVAPPAFTLSIQLYRQRQRAKPWKFDWLLPPLARVKGHPRQGIMLRV